MLYKILKWITEPITELDFCCLIHYTSPRLLDTLWNSTKWVLTADLSCIKMERQYIGFSLRTYLCFTGMPIFKRFLLQLILQAVDSVDHKINILWPTEGLGPTAWTMLNILHVAPACILFLSFLSQPILFISCSTEGLGPTVWKTLL